MNCVTFLSVLTILLVKIVSAEDAVLLGYINENTEVSLSDFAAVSTYIQIWHCERFILI